MDQEKTQHQHFLMCLLVIMMSPDGWSIEASSMGLNAQSGF